jgi:hypothetical protein
MTQDERALEITGIHYPKVPVVRRADYEIALEQFDVWTFAHVRVFKWSSAVRKQFLKDCDAVVEMHGGPLLTLCVPSDAKQRRFQVMAGFEHAGHVTLRDGSPREVMIRKKNNNNGRSIQ